ncbi:MAG: tetratricopeptide repeat protein [Balneola sp.]|jgi:tetratricopeptide (TPR) repeat protein
MHLLSKKLSKIFSILIIGILFSSNLNAQSAIQKGVNLLEEGKIKEARTFLKNYLGTNKKDAEANFYMGRTYFDENAFDKAADWFEKAADLDDRNSKYYMWLGHAYGSRAQNAPKIKQPFLARNSRKNYEKAVELAPKNIEARESLIEYYLQAPGFLGGGVDKAEKQASEIEKIDPVAGGMSWGRIYTYTDQTELAHETYSNLIKNHPDAMPPYYRLNTYYYNEGEFDKAVQLTTNQIAQNDTTPIIYVNRGNSLQQLERFDEALDDYIRALSLDSMIYIAHYQIGRLAAVSGTRLEIGEESIRKFNSKTESYNDATLAWGYYRLGTIMEHKNDIESAKSSYEYALKLDKDHEEAKKALSKLK